MSCESDVANPIISAISEDQGLTKAIRYFATQKWDDSALWITRIVKTAARFNERTQGIEIELVTVPSKQIEELALFGITTLETFEVIDDLEKMKVLVECVYRIVVVVGTISKIPNVNIFFAKMFMFYAACEEARETATLLVEHLIGLRHIQINLTTSSFFQFLTEELFAKAELVASCRWFVDCFVSKAVELKLEVEVSQIPDMFLKAISMNQIAASNAKSAAVYFCRLMAIVTASDDRVVKHFVEHNGLMTFLEFLLRFQVGDEEQLFADLASIQPNVFQADVVSFMFGQIMVPCNSRVPMIFIKSLTILLSMNNVPITEIENHGSISTIFKKKTNEEMLPVLVDMFDVLVGRCYDKLAECAGCVLSALNDLPELDFDITEKFFAAIQKALQNNTVVKSEFVGQWRDNFLNLSELPKMSNLVKNCSSYTLTLVYVYSEMETDERKWDLLKKIMNAESMLSGSEFTILIGKILMGGPSMIVTRNLFGIADADSADKILSLFLASFGSDEATSTFLDSGGLEWVDSFVAKEVLPNDVFVDLISSITKNRVFPQVSSWISSLDITSHVIFSFSLEQLWTMAFGSQPSSTLLRVPALLPCLTSVRIPLSPVNAYNGSKYGLSEFLRHGFSLDDIPDLSRYANQYLRPEHYHLLETRATRVAQFVKPEYDHFSVFEMAPNSKQSAFTIDNPKYKRLCFWFRIESSSDSHTTKILTSDSFSLEATRKLLTFNVGQESRSLSVNSTKWTFVALDLLTATSQISLTANEESIEFDFHRDRLGPVTFGSFDDSSEDRWFIGAAVRLCPSIQDGFLARVFAMGPDSCVVNFNEEKIVMPISSLKNRGKTAYAVPYAGFFSYVRRRQCLRVWFFRLLECTDIEQFDDVLRMLLNCYTVASGNLPNFVSYLCIVLKEKRDLVTDDLFTYVIASMTKVPKQKSMEIFLSDLDFWQLYGRNIYDEVSQSNFSVPADAVAFSLLLRSDLCQSNHWMFSLLLEYSARPINIGHLFAMMFAGNSELNNMIVDVLIRNFGNIKEYACEMVPISTFLTLVEIQTDAIFISKLIDLMVMFSEASPSFLQQPLLILHILTRLVGVERVWFQLWSLLTGTIIFTGNCLLDTFVSLDVIHPECLLAAVGLAIHALIWMNITGNRSPLGLVVDCFSLCNHHWSKLEMPVKLRIGHLVYIRWPLVYHPDVLSEIVCNTESVDTSVVSQVEQLLKDLWKVPIDCKYESGIPNALAPANLLLPSLLSDECTLSPSCDIIGDLNAKHLDVLIEFLSTLIISHVEAPEKFAHILNSVIFQTPLQFMPCIGNFAVRLLVTVLNSDDLIAKMESLVLVFEFVATAIASVKAFGKSAWPLYQLLFPILNRIYERHGPILSISKYVQVILVKMFAYLDPPQVEEMVNVMFASGRILCDEFCVFSSQFVSTFRKRLTKMFPDKYTELEMTVQQGDPAKVHGHVKIADYRKDLMKILTCLGEHQRGVDVCKSAVPAYFRQIMAYQADLSLRISERETCFLMESYWPLHTRGTDKLGFTLSQHTWPFLPCRVLVQTPFPLDPTVLDCENPSEVPVPEILKDSTLTYSNLYPVKYTHIAAKALDPRQYSMTCMPDPKVLLKQFLVVHRIFGDVEDMANGIFIRYTDKKPCVIFVTKTRLMLLLNASIMDDGLELKTDIQSPLLYKTFLDDLKLGIYGLFSVFCGHVVLTLPFTAIIHTRKHYWLHRAVALSISSTAAPEFILAPEKDSFPNSIVERLCQSKSQTERVNVTLLYELTAEKAVNMWSNHTLSTWDLLLTLNGLSGRSFADLSQYPVFPWVVGYDENCELVKRDLTKPMGQQTPKRLPEYDMLYQSSHSHFYGSHYSTASIVHYFLVRIPPFTQISLDLNTGFDDTCRMFTSVSNTWLSASKNNRDDVKELIPEWYCLPEMFFNVNSMNVDSQDPRQFDIVIEGTTPQAFVLRSRAQLETSDNINNWIDLVFGYEQRGPPAVAAKNLFPATSYHVEPTEDTSLATLELQLEHWGQCPEQLFTKPVRERARVKQIPFFNDLTTKTVSNVAISPLILFIPIGDSYNHITVNPLSSVFVIRKSSASKVGWTVFDANLYFATRISQSAKGNFLAVDLEVGLTLIYELRYVNGLARKVKPIGQFTHTFAPNTRINETDFICVSFSDKEYVLWDMHRMATNRSVRLRKQIVDMAFDEYLGLLLILTESWLRVLTINGLKLTGININKRATAMFIPDVPATEILRPIFLGFADGSIAMIGLDSSRCELISMWSHSLDMGPIVHIAFYTSKYCLVCKDRNGKTVLVGNANNIC